MLIERSQVGKREELLDLISRVDAKETPLVQMIPKEKGFRNMLYSWQADDFEDDADLSVEDGEDASNFDNASPNRALISTYMAKYRTTAMVSDLAENVSDVAGLAGGEEAESIMKKTIQLRRSMEAALCGDQDHRAGAAGVAYQVRGLGSWISNSAQALLPVDANYRTVAGCISTESTDDLTTTIIDDLLQASYQVTGQRKNFIGLVGPTLKRQFTTFSTRTVAAASAASQIRAYNTNFNGAIDNVVDMYNGDFGIIDLHPTLFNATARFGGSDVVSPLRGYFLIMDLLALSRKRAPRVKQLEDRGGGPRFLVDSIFGMVVKNPKPLIKIASTVAAD